MSPAVSTSATSKVELSVLATVPKQGAVCDLIDLTRSDRVGKATTSPIVLGELLAVSSLLVASLHFRADQLS